MDAATRTAAVAWLVTAVYYFYQYTLRSAPAVMMPRAATLIGATQMLGLAGGSAGQFGEQATNRAGSRTTAGIR